MLLRQNGVLVSLGRLRRLIEQDDANGMFEQNTAKRTGEYMGKSQRAKCKSVLRTR